MHVRILAGKLDRHAGSHVYHHALAQRLAERGHEISLVFFESKHEQLPAIEAIEIPDTAYEKVTFLWRLTPVLRYFHCRRTLQASNPSRPDVVIGGEHLLLKPIAAKLTLEQFLGTRYQVV